MTISRSVSPSEAGLENAPRAAGPACKRETALPTFLAKEGAGASSPTVSEAPQTHTLAAMVMTAARLGSFRPQPVVVDSPVLFERPIRESYGRYLNPQRRSFSAHA